MVTEKAQDIREGLGCGEFKRLPTVTPEPCARISLRLEFVYSPVYLCIYSFIHPTSIPKLHNYGLGLHIFGLLPALLPL